MMVELISVIIPIYNIEKYLRQCINSVLAQTYGNIEIILVDDGSTDLSGEICDEYQMKYNNVIVIHKKNEGLVSARKSGVKIAKGIYTICVDGDDWIDKDTVACLYERMIDSKCDIAISNRIQEFEATGEKKIQLCTLKPGVYDLKDEDNCFYKQFFVDDAGIGVLHGICGKLIKTCLYKEHQMNVPEKISMGEDAACMYPCYMYADKVYVTEGKFYHYRQHVGSISHISSKNALSNWEELFNYLLEKCRFDNLEVQEVIKTNLEKFIYRRIMLHLNDKFNDLLKKENHEGIMNKSFSTKIKIFEFPFSKVQKNSKVVLYGAGKVGQSYYRQIQRACYCYLRGIYDSALKGQIGEFRIQAPEDLDGESFDFVVISVLEEAIAKNIIKILKDNKISDEKIIWVKPKVYYIDN